MTLTTKGQVFRSSQHVLWEIGVPPIPRALRGKGPARLAPYQA